MSSENSEGARGAQRRPTSQDVISAAAMLQGMIHRTPVLRSRTLDAQLGCEVLLKAENLQRMGAFKIRGASVALAALPAGQAVVAFSSGNHAQAVALAARDQGRPALIVMPADAPRSKVEATRGYGANVVVYDRYREDREEIARRLAQERGGHIIPPFDHPDIVTGQGTAAREVLEDQGPLDAIFVPCGGGGLLAGTLLAAADLAPDCAVTGIEPAAGDDVRQSLAAGRRVRIDPPRTIADGAQTTCVGEVTFPIIQDLAAGVSAVPDEALVAEMRFLAQRMKTIVEPTGALGLAGLRAAVAADPEAWRGRRVGVILSGGNVDLDRFAALVG